MLIFLSLFIIFIIIAVHVVLLQTDHFLDDNFWLFPVQTPRIRDGNFSVWLCLPDELLLNILSYLPHSDLVSCARTCHHFYRVCMDNTLCKQSLSLPIQYSWFPNIIKSRVIYVISQTIMVTQLQPLSVSLVKLEILACY